jgi:hypothetical protein
VYTAAVAVSIVSSGTRSDSACDVTKNNFFLKDPIYLQSVIIHSANGGKGEGWHVEEYSVALLR